MIQKMLMSPAPSHICEQSSTDYLDISRLYWLLSSFFLPHLALCYDLLLTIYYYLCISAEPQDNANSCYGIPALKIHVVDFSSTFNILICFKLPFVFDYSAFNFSFLLFSEGFLLSLHSLHLQYLHYLCLLLPHF